MYALKGTERARQDIAEFFDEYSLSANIGKFVATRILPIREVSLPHGTWPRKPIKQSMKRLAQDGVNPEGYAAQRAPRSAYSRLDLGITEDNYNTQEHGLEGVVDANERNHYSSHWNHERETVEKVYHDLRLERERRVVAALFNTTRFVPGVGGQSQDAGTYQTSGAIGTTPKKWSEAGSTPIIDVWQAKHKIWQKYGVYPDCMVINEHTLRHLQLNESIRAEWIAQGAGGRAHQQALHNFDHSITGTGNQDASASAIAAVLGIDELIVGCSVMDANNSNDPNFAAQHVWGNMALLFKKGQSINDICLGHTMLWTGDSASDGRNTQRASYVENSEGLIVEDYYEPQNRGHVIRVRHQEGQLIKYNVGELITNVS